MNRRSFLQTTVAASSAPLLAADPRPKPPFRVLYSNDATNILSCVSPFHQARQPFHPKMLEATINEVSGLVDAHLLQPGLGMVPMWPSRVLPLAEHYAWIKERYGSQPDSFGNFVLNGGDVVKTFIDHCRLRGQAPFISFRMNDAHHKEFVDPKPGDKPGTSIGMSVTRFYAEHPEHRLKPGSLRGADLVENWAMPAVRQQKWALIRELCENYELAGLELDFLRFYAYFRPEETPLEQRRAILTEFVKDVRALLDRTAKNGQHRWLCARVPCYLPALDVLGLDLKALVAVGLDMVNASSHYFTTQQHDLAAIRRQTEGATLYFELCHTLWKGEKVTAGYDVFPFRRATREHLHTSAHLAYARGADGISLFNFAYYRQHGQGEGRGSFGEPPFDALKDLASPQTLARQPQHWFLASGWRAPGAKPLALPRKLEPGKATVFLFDLAPPEKGWSNPARIRVQANQALQPTDLHATFNGQLLTATPDVSEPYPVLYPSLLGQPEELCAWTLPANLLRPGLNKLELLPHTSATLLFMDLDAA